MRILKQIGFLTCSSTLLFSNLSAQSNPNFVFIMVDDQAYDLLQSAGRYKFLKTPNMDRMEKEGVKFNNYFCAQSLSSPQRASILTGVYPHIHGVTQNHPKIDPDWEKFPSLGTILQKSGYETAFVGKIHMAHKSGKEHIRPGFNHWISFNGQGVYNNPVLNVNGVEIQHNGYITDILTDYSTEFIKKHNPDKPFFLCLWHKAVHGPFTPAQRHTDLYKDEKLPFPPHHTDKETFAGKPKWQIGRIMKSFDYDSMPDSLPAKNWNPYNKQFFGILKTLKAVDESLGVLLKTLEETNQLANTVIIYTSDNGYFMGDHTLQDKRLAYEASMRIPLLIRYPKVIKKKSQIDELCNSLDIPATILDLAGVNRPEHMQGESFLPLLKGQKIAWRNSLFFEYFRDIEYPFSGPTFYAVRTNRYKFIDSMTEGQINELYDLDTDPGEMRNQINNPAYKDILEELMLDSENLKLKLNYNADGDWRIRQLLGDHAIIPKKKK